MLKLILKLVNKIFNLSLGSIVKLIYNILTKNKTVKSMVLLFKWLSILFTIIYLIRDTRFITLLPPLYFLDIYSSYISFSHFKLIWDKLIEWIIKILQALKTVETPVETKLPQPQSQSQPWLIESNPDRIDFSDSDQLDLKKTKT